MGTTRFVRMLGCGPLLAVVAACSSDVSSTSEPASRATATATTTPSPALAYFEGAVDGARGTMTLTVRSPLGDIRSMATLPYGTGSGDVYFHTCGTPTYSTSTHQLSALVQAVNLMAGTSADAFNAVIDSISATGVTLGSGANSGASSGIIASYGSVGATTADCTSSQRWVFQNTSADASFTFVGHATGSTFPTPDFLWLDANDASTLTLSSANVTQWSDKSGLGRNATVGNGYTSPTLGTAVGPNSTNAVYFGTSTSGLQTGNATTVAEMTIFVAFNMVSPGSWADLVDQSHDTYYALRVSSCCGGNSELNFHIQNDNAAPIIPVSNNTWQVVTARRQAGTSYISYGTNAPTSFTGDTLTAGGSAPIDIGNSTARGEEAGGYIAEIRMYGEALSPANIAAIQTNLLAKY